MQADEPLSHPVVPERTRPPPGPRRKPYFGASSSCRLSTNIRVRSYNPHYQFAALVFAGSFHMLAAQTSLWSSLRHPDARIAPRLVLALISGLLLSSAAC